MKNRGSDSPLDLCVSWRTCGHKFVSYFGPVLKCIKCGATTMVSMDGKSKPISEPDNFDDVEELEAS